MVALHWIVRMRLVAAVLLTVSPASSQDDVEPFREKMLHHAPVFLAQALALGCEPVKPQALRDLAQVTAVRDPAEVVLLAAVATIEGCGSEAKGTGWNYWNSRLFKKILEPPKDRPWMDHLRDVLAYSYRSETPSPPFPGLWDTYDTYIAGTRSEWEIFTRWLPKRLMRDEKRLRRPKAGTARPEAE